ncbi:hypothetical protein B0O99DRAFT_321760 [Bisporella sp. PMI_857]|nr:hypothetical protein B0O99DRAFT_371264 [Bisporella sp. PMI_857]KAH8600292.1 hypothetical protein B0O99DRAFT_321760 [Bisporella sp. PMI_857]
MLSTNHNLTLLVGLLYLCFLHSIANAQNAAYAMWFQPGVLITKITSTVIVPKVSTGKGFHALWPGLQNSANNFVYQNVIADSKSPGTWQFFIEYCCNPNVEYPAVKVQPGDKIVSTMSYNTISQLWTNTYTISGSVSQSASYSDSFNVGLIDKVS